VRVDAAVKPGLELTPEYDPLLAKVMVHAADRPGMVGRLRRALDEMLVGGLQTDLGFHRWLVDQPEFVDGGYDTGLIAARWGEHGPALSEQERGLAALAAAEGRVAAGSLPAQRPPAMPPAGSPWARLAREEGLRR
jgi:acetyl/propionyl-CoA carboxylase alpha subunit